jgi:hypothetical protein
MKLSRTTALTAALMTAALVTSQAQAGYGYGNTGYIPPGPFTPAFGGTNGYGGYGPRHGRAAYRPVARRHIYATAPGVHHYRYSH